LATTGAQSDLPRLQQRTVRVLASAQVLGGIGVASGIAVGALLAADLGTESLSGLASASSVIGAALISLPVARLMNTRGRRLGLLLAYAVGITGALLTITGALVGIFSVALVGMVLTGGGTAAGLQSRYAATDLAVPEHRGRALGTVVWATTVGSVLGPNLAQPMGHLAISIGVPRLAGPYMLTVVTFVAAAAVIALFLRPDPLLVARGEAARLSGTIDNLRRPTRSLRASLSDIMRSPSAAVGLLAMASGHAVMVGVMAMTPIHLQHGGASLGIIGLVISGHISGMYIASPLVGILSDRFGRHAVIVGGALILLAAVGIAGTASEYDSTRIALGLFLLGLGWSCTLVAGSTLLTESVGSDVRPTVQGAADLVMGVAGASAGVLSGVVVGLGSYGLLTVIAAVLVAPLPVIAIRDSRRVASVA
jgi:MFS family permease